MAYRPGAKYAVLGLLGALALVAGVLVTFGEDLLLRIPLR